MDSLTHVLLSATTAQLGFRQRIGRDAAWVAAAVGVLPDLDIFVTPFLTLSGVEVDDLSTLAVHRGLSHSLLFAPLLAAPAALMWWWFRRKIDGRKADAAPGQRPASFLLLYCCVLAALATHPLLDWCTSYGTELLAPLTRTRYAIDCVPIVDIIYPSLLVLTLLACYLTRKLARPTPLPACLPEAGRPASRGNAVRATLVVAWVGFGLSVSYLATGRLMHDRAASLARAAVGADAGNVIRADAYPSMGTILLWRAVVETDSQWLVARVHVFGDNRPGSTGLAGIGRMRLETAAKQDSPWIDKASELHQVKTYRWFAGGRVRAECEQENGKWVVTFHDMRYGWPQDSIRSMWPLEVVFSADGKLLEVTRRRAERRGRLGELIPAMWHDIWNP